MSKNKKTHHREHDGTVEHVKKKQELHKDWRTWTAVILMLVAMLAYILSEDESLAPGGGQQEEVEAVE